MSETALYFNPSKQTIMTTEEHKNLHLDTFTDRVNNDPLLQGCYMAMNRASKEFRAHDALGLPKFGDKKRSELYRKTDNLRVAFFKCWKAKFPTTELPYLYIHLDIDIFNPYK